MRSTRGVILGAAQAMVLLAPAAQADMPEEKDDTGEPPMAEVCLLPMGAEDNTCAAFFLDEDGYEICLRDEPSKRVRCASSHHTANEVPEAPRPKGPQPLGI